jgi:hypothetical protein
MRVINEIFIKLAVINGYNPSQGRGVESWVSNEHDPRLGSRAAMGMARWSVQIKRYACHAAPCCKQLDRRTLSGPCFSMLAISAHLTFSCVVCPALWPPVCAVQTQHRVCPCMRGTSFKERRKARARVVRQVGDRAAPRHRELASVEYSTVWVAPSA